MKTTKKFTFVVTEVSEKNARGLYEAKRIYHALYEDGKTIAREEIPLNSIQRRDSPLSRIAGQINRLSEGFSGSSPSVCKGLSPHQNLYSDLYMRFSPKLKGLYSAVHRLLPGGPGQRIYLTATGVHIDVDQSGLSQEKRLVLSERMGDFLAQASKENISTSTLIVKSASQCI